MKSKHCDKASGAFIRARSPEQKAQRRQEIKDVAAALFAEVSYHEITLTTIADRLQWSRANLYKYVATKEEIFLELYLDRYALYMADLRTACFTEEDEVRTECLDPAVAASKVAAISERHSLVLRLYELLPSIIESNVRFETLVEFKRNFAEIDSVLEKLFGALCPETSERAQNIMLHSYLIQSAGLLSMVECGALARRAMEQVGVPYLLPDLDTALCQFFVMLVEYYNAHPAIY